MHFSHEIIQMTIFSIQQLKQHQNITPIPSRHHRLTFESSNKIKKFWFISRPCLADSVLVYWTLAQASNPISNKRKYEKKIWRLPFTRLLTKSLRVNKKKFLISCSLESTSNWYITLTCIHTYIIGHYNPSVRIIDPVSHTIYVACVNFIHKWRDP